MRLISRFLLSYHSARITSQAKHLLKVTNPILKVTQPVVSTFGVVQLTRYLLAEWFLSFIGIGIFYFLVSVLITILTESSIDSVPALAILSGACKPIIDDGLQFIDQVCEVISPGRSFFWWKLGSIMSILNSWIIICSQYDNLKEVIMTSESYIDVLGSLCGLYKSMILQPFFEILMAPISWYMNGTTGLSTNVWLNSYQWLITFIYEGVVTFYRDVCYMITTGYHPFVVNVTLYDASGELIESYPVGSFSTNDQETVLFDSEMNQNDLESDEVEDPTAPVASSSEEVSRAWHSELDRYMPKGGVSTEQVYDCGASHNSDDCSPTLVEVSPVSISYLRMIGVMITLHPYILSPVVATIGYSFAKITMSAILN